MAIGLIVCGALFGLNLGTWFVAGMILFAAGAILYSTSNVLHHFPDAQLARLGAILQRGAIRHILANEPCRRSLHKIQLRAGRLIGFNPVTLYDGVVSIDGGFRNSELPRALGLDPQQWSWTIRETALGAYRMEAKRQ